MLWPIIILFTAGGFVFTCLARKYSVEGYQDGSGFHHGPLPLDASDYDLDGELIPFIDDESDPGSYAEVLRFVRFPVSDFHPLDDGGHRLPDADGAGSVLSFHDNLNSPEGSQDHA